MNKNKKPKYLLAIYLLNDDYEEEDDSKYCEPNLFSFDQLTEIENYTKQDFDEGNIILVDLVAPNYKFIYQEEDGFWNYEDTNISWEVFSECECMGMSDIIEKINEYK